MPAIGLRVGFLNELMNLTVKISIFSLTFDLLEVKLYRSER